MGSKNNNKAIKSTVKSGISFGTCLAMIISYTGTCLAMIISYTAWKSIPWAIFHGLLSWIYVIYYWFTY